MNQFLFLNFPDLWNLIIQCTKVWPFCGVGVERVKSKNLSKEIMKRSKLKYKTEENTKKSMPTKNFYEKQKTIFRHSRRKKC